MIQGISGAGGMPDFSRLQQMRQQAFQQADADASGGLQLAEFQALEGPGGVKPSEAQSKQLFGQLDSDRDGALTQAEMDDGLQQLMQRMSTQAFSGFTQQTGDPSRSGGNQQLQVLQSLLATLQQGDGASRESAASERSLSLRA